MKKLIVRLMFVLVVGAISYGGYTAYKQLPAARQSSIATAKVRQGDVVVKTYARGELRAVRSATLTAPNLFGTVQVTKLAALGAFSKDKDLIAEFDDSELLSRIEEKQLELDQLDEQIKKSRADLSIRENQDQVELLRTRYSVRRAELEVKRNELLSAIDAKKNELSLEEARRRLVQLESDIKSRREQAQAELAVLREKKNKAVLEMNREKLRMGQVKLLSPISGLVSIRQNRGSGFMMFGQQLPDIREGDQLQPGMPVADVLDLSELEIVARIGELDRANLKEGQDVNITLDAIADKHLTGKIKSMSGTASSNVFSSDPAKKFDVLFSIDMKQLLTALGASQEQINRVLATAEANRKKPVPTAPPMAMMGGMGGMGGGMPGGPGAQAGPGGAGPGMQAPGGPMGGGGAGMPGAGGPPTMGFRPPGGGGQGGAGGSGMTPEQTQKMRDLMQKALAGKNMQDLSPEERQKLMAKVREDMQKAGVSVPARGAERKGGEGGAGEPQADGQRQARRERKGGGPDGMPPGMTFGSGAQKISQKDLDNAKLPPPPEESDNLDVLMRPGLLADVEIIVEKIQNAVHVPAQAVFQKDGKFLVFVKKGNKITAREVKILKRSESLMIIADGLKAGEEITMQDPDAKPDPRKKGGAGKGDSGGGGSPMMPTGKKG